MTQNKFGQLIFSETDVIDLLMQDPDRNLDKMIVDDTVKLSPALADILDHTPDFIRYSESTLTVEEFDHQSQQNWLMPEAYKNVDIAKYILDLCTTPEQLQRVGEELLLYQERDLFDLLKYLHYLVDVMKEHKIIWGVGRGSSVASYVLYLLKVHAIDSMYYDLDPGEFLR